MLIASKLSEKLLIIVVILCSVLQGGEMRWQTSMFIAILALALILITNDSIISYLANFRIDKKITVIGLIFSGYYLTYYISTYWDISALNGFTTTSIYNIQENFLIILMYFIFYILLKYHFDNMEKLKALNKVIVVTGICIAIYSLLNLKFEGSLTIFHGVHPWVNDWKSNMSGTMSYKNHYSAYLNFLFYFSLIHFNKKVNKKTTAKFNVFIVLFIVFLVLQLLTGSRFGMFIYVISSILLFIIFYKKILKVSKYILVGLVPVLTFSIIYFFGFNKFVEIGLSMNGRDDLYISAINMIKDNFLFGVGPNGYASEYAAYKLPSLGITEMSKKAHNDYIEFFANYGLFGTLMLLIFIVTIKNKILSFDNREHQEIFAAKLSIINLSLHALIDFMVVLPIFIMMTLIMVNYINVTVYNLKKKRSFENQT